MKCKVCKEKIDFHVFGAPEDICWGCLQEEAKEVIVKHNVTLAKN